MMKNKKRVAVVGAGTSGMMAIKCLKEEGFLPVCFEKSSYFGGLWHYHEDDVTGVPSVMWSTSLNNSKEVGALSDFPPPSESANFMRHFKVLEMFKEYGEKFDLLRHIKYNSEVTKVERARDYDQSGRWKVTIKNVETKDEKDEVFDAVLVCVGHLSLPKIPEFPQLSSFEGEIMHTHSIKKFRNFDNKSVCVIGTGSSALDAAVEISHRANQVYLSVRNTTWIYTRHGPYGYPIDWTLFTWDHNILQNIVPLSWCNKVVEEIFINPRFSHDLYNICPKRGAVNRDPAVNDGIPSRMMNGAIKLKKDIEYFTENGVVFCDEDKETKLDTVVLGTGYDWAFPFLDSKDFVTEGNKIHLYKCVYPPHLPHPTLGVVGFIVPMGPGFPCVEMQCRWFAHVLSGKGRLPSKSEMIKDINKQYQENIKRYGESDRVYIHVDFIPYLEDIASKIGALPSMLKLFLTDIKLFVSCAIGPYVPYRFRLVGPHRWEGARNAILTTGQRMRAPLQGNRAFETNVQKRLKKRYIFICLLVIAGYLQRHKLMKYEYYMICYRVFIFCVAMLTNFVKTGKLF